MAIRSNWTINFLFLLDIIISFSINNIPVLSSSFLAPIQLPTASRSITNTTMHPYPSRTAFERKPLARMLKNKKPAYMYVNPAVVPRTFISHQWVTLGNGRKASWHSASHMCTSRIFPSWVHCSSNGGRFVLGKAPHFNFSLVLVLSV